MPTLIRRGSRGKDVEKLQKHLDQLFPLKHPSILRPDGSADGIFGPQTQEWVEEFQRTPPAINDDGVVGPITWQKLKDKLPLSFSGAVDSSAGSEPEVADKKINVSFEKKLLSDLTQAEIEELYNKLREDIPLQLPLLHSFISILGEANRWGGVAMNAGKFAAIFSEAAFLAFAAPGSLVTGTISSLILWIKAWEDNERMYATRAWAYAITAWTFNKPVPSSSLEMMKRFRFSNQEELRELDISWKRASWEAYGQMNSQPGKHNLTKKEYQIALMIKASQSLHTGTLKEKMCLELLIAREGDFSGWTERGTILDSWKLGYDVLYPR